jgi:hypothetical protein
MPMLRPWLAGFGVPPFLAEQAPASRGPEAEVPNLDSTAIKPMKYEDFGLEEETFSGQWHAIRSML